MTATLESDVSDLDAQHQRYLDWLKVLKVRNYVRLGMAHRKFHDGGTIITTVMIPPSYRELSGEETHTIQAALLEDN